MKSEVFTIDWLAASLRLYNLYNLVSKTNVPQDPMNDKPAQSVTIIYATRIVSSQSIKKSYFAVQ